MNPKRKLDSESIGNKDNKRPKKDFSLRRKINLLDNTNHIEEVINTDMDEVGEEHLEDHLQDTESEEEDFNTIPKSPMTEKVLLQALQMAKELADILAANDDDMERSIKAKKMLESIMAPYRKLLQSFDEN